MQAMLEKESDQYSFEITQEVLEKMQNAEDLHRLIQEDQVSDLVYVDVSHRTYHIVKRLIDVVIAGVGLCVMAVPMLLIALAIHMDDPGEVVFSQYRVGMGGKRFKLYKFRTMKKNTPKYMATAELQGVESYVTKVGRFLRNSSLDELPQLWNVLKGDMSLIGPRPLISDEYEIHSMRMRFGVYNIRPGVTGLAQISGRDLVTPAEKIRLDVAYLQQFGFGTDMRILLATIPKILTREGVEDKEEFLPADKEHIE